MSTKLTLLNIEVRTDIITISKNTIRFDKKAPTIILNLLFFVLVSLESLNKSCNDVLNFFINFISTNYYKFREIYIRTTL